MIWLERANACGNDDAFTEIFPFRCGQSQMTGFQYFEIIHAFVEAKVRAELTALFVEFADEIASQNGGKTADIINIFFGIERGDLSAGARQCLKHEGLQVTHPRVECREQTHRSRA